MQPIYFDERGTARFRANKIVQWMVARGAAGKSFDLNTIVIELGGLDIEEHEQFNQLLGYSVSGYGDIAGMRSDTVAVADEIVEAMVAERKNSMP